MFWALASGEVDPRRFEFEHVLRDIQTLNTWALDGKLEVSAISLAAYPLVQDKYVLLPHGASMGSGYGPIVVAREELSLADARDVEIAVPGELTRFRIQHEWAEVRSHRRPVGPVLSDRPPTFRRSFAIP